MYFFGTWELGDTLIDTAFNNKDFQILNGAGIESYMGKWSDGAPVNELAVYGGEVLDQQDTNI